jgi:hypothetical protein
MCTKCLDKEQCHEILPYTFSSVYSIFLKFYKFLYAIKFSAQCEACITCLFAAARQNLTPLSAYFLYGLTQNKYEYSKGLKRS